MYFIEKNQAQLITSTMLYAEHNILRSDPSCTLFLIQQFKDSTTETSFLNKSLKLVLLGKTNTPKHSEIRAVRLRNPAVCLREDKNDPFFIFSEYVNHLRAPLYLLYFFNVC